MLELKKHIRVAPLLCLLLLAVGLISCEETEAVGEYDNWKQRNVAFIDSIANVARDNADGKWKVIKAWNKPDDNPSTGIGQIGQINNQDYVYIHSLKDGNGEVSPCYTDSVSVSYRGRLINRRVFEETFASEVLNPETAGRTTLYLNKLITGMTTALQQMKEGDWWMIYIPYPIAYEESNSGSVPAYSDLIFELYLAKVNP